MGMFDTILFHDNNDKEIFCKNGHKLKNDTFQTKDLENSFTLYHLYDNKIFNGNIIKEQNIYKRTLNTLSITTKEIIQDINITDTITIYRDCYMCLPVVYVHNMVYNHDNLNIRRPWIEYNVSFKEGQLTNVSMSCKTESHEDVVKSLSRFRVLDNDDPLAMAHVEKNRWSERI